MSEDLIQLVGEHGAAALFGILVANCLGVPFPTSLLLLALGSFVGQGEMALWPLLAAGIAGAVVGDQAGYLIGRMGGRVVTNRLARRPQAAAAVAKAEKLVWRWGGVGVFFSRWLLSPLGPWVNLATGMTRYPWARFAVWDFLGLSVWIGLYLGLGMVFSRSVQNLADLLGSLTWLLIFGVLTVLLGWRLLRRLRQATMARLEARFAPPGDPRSR